MANVNLINNGTRKCVKCGIWKLFSEYHKHKGCKEGINTVCKSCRKPLSKEHYRRNSREYNIWHRTKVRAKTKGIPFTIEMSDIIIPDICPVFKVSFKVNDHNYAPSIDKIIPHLGYIKGNIQIISNRANMLKGNATVDEIKQLYDFMKGEVN